MKEEEQLRVEVDKLTARSWAQEALLLHLAQRSGLKSWWDTTELEAVALELRQALRRSSLTDSQIERFEKEMTRLLLQLHRPGDL